MGRHGVTARRGLLFGAVCLLRLGCDSVGWGWFPLRLACGSAPPPSVGEARVSSALGGSVGWLPPPPRLWLGTSPKCGGGKGGLSSASPAARWVGFASPFEGEVGRHGVTGRRGLLCGAVFALRLGWFGSVGWFPPPPRLWLGTSPKCGGGKGGFPLGLAFGSAPPPRVGEAKGCPRPCLWVGGLVASPFEGEVGRHGVTGQRGFLCGAVCLLRLGCGWVGVGCPLRLAFGSAPPPRVGEARVVFPLRPRFWLGTSPRGGGGKGGLPPPPRFWLGTSPKCGGGKGGFAPSASLLARHLPQGWGRQGWFAPSASPLARHLPQGWGRQGRQGREGIEGWIGGEKMAAEPHAARRLST